MSKVHSFSDEDGDNTKFDFLVVVTMTNTVFCKVNSMFLVGADVSVESVTSIYSFPQEGVLRTPHTKVLPT